ncbi:hypothetical protein [Kandleria sp.]|nr:hypothetical protein [Kandleria sp.]MBP3275261.1 hypothetical protein [Kandleria sp.]
MIAGHFAKQYDAILPFIKERKLDHWGDNKTIQKAIKQKEEPKKLKEIPN